jgi:hypothetical protein
MTIAALGYVGYGLETVEGTFVAPTIFLPVSSFNFDNTNEYIMPDQIRGSRDRSVKMPAAFSTSGSMDTELTPNGIGGLLRSAFSAAGALVESSPYSGGGYEHEFTPGDTSPTFTFEMSAGNVVVMRYGGIRVNTLEINAAFNEIVTASWGLEGTTRTKHSGGLATESFADAVPFHFTGASMLREGVEVGTVKSFNFTIGNNIDRIGTLRKTRNWKRTAMGMRDVGLSATFDFEDDEEYDLFLDETEFDLTLHLEAGYISGTSGPKNSLVIEIPRVSWNTANLPLNSTDYLEYSVEATILRPLDGDPILTATLVNSEATVVGA